MKLQPLKRLSLQLVVEKEFVRLVMPTVTATGWKVLTFMILEADDAGGKPVPLSYKSIRKGTGLSSDSTVSLALDGLVDKELVLVHRPANPTQANSYQINIEFELEVEDTERTTETVERRATETVVRDSVSTIINIDQDSKKERKNGKEKEDKQEGKSRIVKEEKGSVKLHLFNLLPESFFETSEFVETWVEWTTDRRARKKPVTPLAARKQIKLLGKFPVEVAIAMINQSILSGWTGIFQLRAGDPILVKYQTSEGLQDPSNVKLKPLRSA